MNLKWLSAVGSWTARDFCELRSVDGRMVQSAAEDVFVQVCSTQYLGLPWRKDFAQALQGVLEGAAPSDWGSLGSNFLGGTHPFRIRAERLFREVLHTEDCVFFASGWAANYAIGEVCRSAGMNVISDGRSHNSLRQGLRGSSVVVADLVHRSIREVLDEAAFDSAVVCWPMLEGLTGEAVCPVVDDGSIRERCYLIRDEIHSFGVLGASGVGCPGYPVPDVRVIGFSKAFGLVGAAVCGPHGFVEALRQRASPWIFSTAVPPIIWEVVARTLDVVMRLDDERALIMRRADQFRARCGALGVPVSGTNHISSVRLRPEEVARLEDRIRQLGYYARVSQFPSRPVGSPCMRVCFSPAHEEGDVSGFAEALGAVLGRAG
jgi:8-amino-7-oxononanoate synthase